jgi:hypothetical protein
MDNIALPALGESAVRRIVVMYPYNQAKLAPNPATGVISVR